MIKKTKNNITITQCDENYIKGYKIFTVCDRSFIFYINLKDGSSSVGFNSSLCVKEYTDNGYVNVVDNRFLGIPDPNFYKLKNESNFETLEKILKEMEAFVQDLLMPPYSI